MPQTETLLTALLHGLLLEGRVPPGSVIDAGAFDGQTACEYASVAPATRRVHALDPTPGNVAFMTKRFPNISPMLGGLGSTARNISVATTAGAQLHGLHESSGGPEAGRAAVTTVPIYRIDDLFAPAGAWAGERLGLAHLDVEGAELDVLRGAEDTLRTHRPFFVVELFVHKNASYTRELLGIIRRLGFHAYVIEEQCGRPRGDGRNLLCVPSEARGSLHGSPSLDLLAASRRLFAVDELSIFDRGYGPCCRPGTACEKGCHYRCVGTCLQRMFQGFNTSLRDGPLDPRTHAANEWATQSMHRFVSVDRRGG